MAAEVLKKKIQDLMKERDDALEKGDELENELNQMKDQLLKVTIMTFCNMMCQLPCLSNIWAVGQGIDNFS